MVLVILQLQLDYGTLRQLTGRYFNLANILVVDFARFSF
jgi:hypothetical protein